jgi:hypothetical protein
MKPKTPTREELINEWKKKWSISNDTKVWWIKMTDDFFNLGIQKGKQQTLKEFYDWLIQTEVYLFGKDEEIIMKVKQIEKELGVKE